MEGTSKLSSMPLREPKRYRTHMKCSSRRRQRHLRSFNRSSLNGFQKARGPNGLPKASRSRSPQPRLPTQHRSPRRHTNRRLPTQHRSPSRHHTKRRLATQDRRPSHHRDRRQQGSATIGVATIGVASIGARRGSPSATCSWQQHAFSNVLQQRQLSVSP